MSMYHVGHMSCAPGTRLGPFEVRTRLDLGGLGEVYSVRDHEHQRDAAMRVLPADFNADPDLLKRFEREARAAAVLAHENILTIHNIGTDARAVYIITEPIEGRTLRDVLSSGVLSVHATLQFGVQIAHALAAAHERGIVHGDLKPEHVVVGPEGRVRVAGFGLAAVTHVESAFAGLKGVAAGTKLGSPAYMSPEHVRGVPPDARSDVFTLGAILYEMSTGARAFAGDTPLVTMTAVVQTNPTVPADVQLPPALERTIEACLEKKPGRRPAAADVARMLDDLGRRVVAGVPAETVPAPRRRLVRVVMLLALWRSRPCSVLRRSGCCKRRGSASWAGRRTRPTGHVP
jgi:serine/threonine protein kinase